MAPHKEMEKNSETPLSLLTFLNGGSLVLSVTDDFRVHSLTEYSVSL